GGANAVIRPAVMPPTGPALYEVIPEPPAAKLPEASSSIGTLAAAMKEHIERALVATRGRIEGRGGTADLLGINPHTLRARMRKLKIDWSRFRESG
ncbi:MAG TPA: helix-turn-helix domain-containing protein, partial [Pirellulaceae bacterium]|nr:helix-turn-helix domain-containing protein [Pirellulaceae bacterium]